MLGTAGHVDHGKTALIKMLTGCNTDRLVEEQRRGLTIDLGYAPCRLRQDNIVGVVDVPGHVDFIRNMVAGAHGIDIVLFVVAANDGVMPQTREHLDILTLMGVRHGIIALTKIDLVDEEMLVLALDDVQQFVAGTFLEGAPICPLSNITFAGFDAFFSALNEAVAACAPRESAGLFRMWISEVFSIHGFGTVVTGIPSNGTLHIGDKLHLLPGEGVGRVRRLEVYGEDAAEGRAGECVAANVVDLPVEELTRGRMLCGSDALHPVTMVEAELRLLDVVARPLKDYLEVHLHIGTAEAMAHVAVLDDKELHPARTHLVQLRLSEPLGVAPGDRFVIRAGIPNYMDGRVTTIGGGRVLGVSDTRLRRQRQWTLDMLAARSQALASPTAWCAQILHEAAAPLTPAALAKAALMTAEQVNMQLTRLRADGTVIAAGAHGVVHRAVIDSAKHRLTEMLTAFHKDNPLALGSEEAVLLNALALPKAVFEMAVAQLLDAQHIERQGVVLKLRGHAVRLANEDERLLQRIETTFRQAALCPPEPAELEEAVQARGDKLRRLVGLLVEDGTLVKLPPDLLMHRDAVAVARACAVRLFAQAGEFTTMDFRDALGVSRKYAVPLLDYFDATRWTVRSGNRRTPGVEAKKMLSNAPLDKPGILRD